MVNLIAMIGEAHVDGFWSTALLSVARSMIAATSVGNVALFAGGAARCPPECALLCMEGRCGGWGVMIFARACLVFARAAVLQLCFACDLALSLFHVRHCR